MSKDKAISVTVKVDSRDLKKLYEAIDALTRRVEALEAKSSLITTYGPLTVRTDARHQDVMDAIAKAAKQQSRGDKH